MLRFILRLFISIILLIFRRLPPEFSKKSSLKLLKFSFDYLNSLFSTYADKDNLEDDKFQLNGLSFKNNIGIAAGLDKEGKYFSALGYGEFRPVIDVAKIDNFNDKQEARAKNRRVEIYLDAFFENIIQKQEEIDIDIKT